MCSLSKDAALTWAKTSWSTRESLLRKQRLPPDRPVRQGSVRAGTRVLRRRRGRTRCEENIVHNKSRRHSALLLLVAPVVAIGSSFLVAGSASATAQKTKTIKPTITVCKSVAGTFRFTVNGKALALHAQCAAVTAKAGVNHVTEISAPASYRNLASISVSPNAARVSSSLRTATVTVKLAAHGAATVRFVNAKVVTQVVTRSTGSAPARPRARSRSASTRLLNRLGTRRRHQLAVHLHRRIGERADESVHAPRSRLTPERSPSLKATCTLTSFRL